MTQIEYQSYTVLNFVENWINKETRSDNLENKELVHEFNKFFSYFVAFNALYNEVYFQETGKTVGMSDNKKAMNTVITFLGDTELKNALGRADAEIGFIKKVIDDNIFRFHFNEKTINKVKMNGQQLDAYYRNNLNDNCTSDKYCEAVFSFLYQVRCNMFHGSKEFEPNQKKLIQSMNVILEVLIEFLKKELSTSNNLRTSFRRTQ